MFKKFSTFLPLLLIVGHLAAVIPSNVINMALGFDIERTYTSEEDSNNEAEDNDTEENEENENENEFFKEYLITNPSTDMTFAMKAFWDLASFKKSSGPNIDLSNPPPER